MNIISNLFDGIGESISELISGIITGWIQEFMGFVLGLITDLVFDIPTSTFAYRVITILSSVISVAAVVVILYKIIEYMIKVSDGTQQEPFGALFVRVGKSAGALLVLPWFLNWFLFDIAVPLSNFFITASIDFEAEIGYELIAASIAAYFTGIGAVVMIVLMIFFLFAFIMFIFSICVFYADIIIMQVYIAPVALSMIADDNNFFQVWWRELFSLVLSMLTKLFLVTLLLNTIFSGGNLFLAIGSGVLLIKSPSLLKNMWYGGGGSKGATRGAGAVGSMSSRVMISKLIR